MMSLSVKTVLEQDHHLERKDSYAKKKKNIRKKEGKERKTKRQGGMKKGDNRR